METKRKISELNAVAEELNEVCGCKPAIKVLKGDKGSKKQKEALVAEIIEGAECIVLDEDEGDFKEGTIVILKELECWPSEDEEEDEEDEEEEEAPAPKKGKGKKAAKVEEDEEEDEEEVVEKPAKKGKGKKAAKVVEEDEDEDEDDDSEVSLEDKLKKAKSMVDLKALVEEYPAEFKKAKKAIKEANNPIKLKKAMRDALGIVPAEKPAKKAKKEAGPSNKGIVYTAWVEKKTITAEKLHQKCNEGVQLSTIKSWLKQWEKGQNLPAVAKTI